MAHCQKTRKQDELSNAHRLWVLNECFCNTHLPLLFRNARIFEDLLTTRLGISLPCVFSSIRRIRGQQVKSLHHLLESIPISEACTSYSDVLLKTEVLNLMEDGFGVVFGCTAILVWLDRSNIGGLSFHQVLYQCPCGLLHREILSEVEVYKRSLPYLDPVSSSRGSLLAIGVRTIRKERL